MSDIGILVFSTEEIAWFCFISGLVLGIIVGVLGMVWFRRARQNKNIPR